MRKTNHQISGWLTAVIAELTVAGVDVDSIHCGAYGAISVHVPAEHFDRASTALGINPGGDVKDFHNCVARTRTHDGLTVVAPKETT